MSEVTEIEFISFPIYAGESRRGLYVECRVFKTRDEMQKVCRAEAAAFGRSDLTTNDFAACVMGFELRRHGRLLPIFGNINFYRDGLSTENVTHEFGHVMFAWAARKGIVYNADDVATEELLCYTLGRLVARFGLQATAAKLI